jgi:hypothetical protein
MNQLHSLIIFKSDTSQNRVLIYQYDPYQGIEVLKDSWSLKHGFLTGSQVHLINQHQDLKGYKLKVATPPFRDLFLLPYYYVGSDRNGESFYDGTDIILLKYLADRMNFHFSFHESVDGKWGGQTDNGSWNGMIGMIERGVNPKTTYFLFHYSFVFNVFKQDVDMALGSITITGARSTVVDFSYPYLSVSTLAFVSHQPALMSKALGLVWPFGDLVWACNLATLISFGLIVYLIHLLSGDKRLSIGYCYSYMFMIILEQSQFL